MVDENKIIQPKSIAIHTASYAEFLERQLGAIDFNQAWNNFFSQCEAVIKLILQLQDALDRKIINISKLDEVWRSKDKIYNVMQIWNGGCFITKNRNPDNPTEFLFGKEKFHYDESKIDYNNPNLEVIPLPALDNMTPIGEIKHEVWGIRISESIPFKYAFNGCVYDTVIREGGFYYKVENRLIAKFKEEEMNSLTKKTHRVSRDYYYKVIKILKNKFLENWSPVENDMHVIIRYLVEGLDEDEYEEMSHHKAVVGKLAEIEA